MSKSRCCGCGCTGQSCLKGPYETGCSHPCCWCSELKGLTTCDAAYAPTLAACMAELTGDGSSSTAFCDKTISVSLTTSVSPTIDCDIIDGFGEILETLTLPWTTVHQITNHTNTFGPAENAGDAPFFQPCASGVQFTCNTGEDATDSQGNSCKTATGDPTPFNSTCWNDCPAYGNMWKPSHYTTVSTSSWHGVTDLSITLAYQGGCGWSGSTTVTGDGATRIWLTPNDDTDYYDQDLGSCYTSGGIDCDSGYEGCCHCSACQAVSGCAGIDCSSTEAGCILGWCGYSDFETDNWLPCGGSQEPYPRVRFVPGGYTSYEVEVHYTLTYTLQLTWPSQGNPGNPPDAVWVHKISLVPDYQLAASSVPTDRAGDYIGEWAEIIGTMPGSLTVPGYVHCSSGCDGGCNETGYLNNPCNGLPEGSTPDDYTRHEWASRLTWLDGGYFAHCNPCAGPPLAHSTCPTYSGGSGVPPSPITERSGWCVGGGPVRTNPKPFWYSTLSVETLSATTMGAYNGPLLTCGDVECVTGTNCTGEVLYGGEFFTGTAMEYRQTIPAASQCSHQCPVATTFTRGGWTVQMTVT